MWHFTYPIKYKEMICGTLLSENSKLHLINLAYIFIGKIKVAGGVQGRVQA
jgi:hypothetical protein